MICNTCGSESEENTTLCTQCGAPIQSENEPAYDEAPVYASPEATDEAPAGEVSPKSRTVALVLSIVLGHLGINRLYLGLLGSGIPRLIILIIGACLSTPYTLYIGLIPVSICSLFGIIDIIRVATGKMVDGNGLPVKNW